MSKFPPTSKFKWIDPNKFDSNEYSSNSSKACVLEVDAKHPKEWHKLHNYRPLAPEIKKEMLSNYQLKIADFYYIHIDTVENTCFIIQTFI